MNLTSRNIAFFCGYPTSDAFILERRRYEWGHFFLRSKCNLKILGGGGLMSNKMTCEPARVPYILC